VTFSRIETRASLPVTKFSEVVRWEPGKISHGLVIYSAKEEQNPYV